MPTPPVEFQTSSLPAHLQTDASGKRRKPLSASAPASSAGQSSSQRASADASSEDSRPAATSTGKDGAAQRAKDYRDPVDLNDCALRKLFMYNCVIDDNEESGADWMRKGKSQDGDAPEVLCRPVVRFFRQCQGGLSVEVTAWERMQRKAKGALGAEGRV